MQEKRKVFAIVGMAGTGKSEVIKYLQKKYRWPKVYIPEILFEELKKQNLELNWKNEKKIREEMRKEHGQNVFVERSLPKIREELKSSRVVILESLYGWGEHEILKKAYPDYFTVIGVWASPAVRFERIKNRSYRPIKTFKEFQERDRNEIEVTEKGGPIAIADYMLLNNGSIDDIHREIDRIMIKEGLMEQPSVEDRN